MPRSLMLVYSSPTSPEQEAEYNDWYTNKHLKEVVALPGLVSATRYQLEEAVSLDGVPTSAARYLAIYEVEGDSVEAMNAAKQALAEGMETGTIDMSPALDPASLQVDFVRQITGRVV